MDATLRRLVREVESRPENAAGRDKTWVLHAMWQYVVFLRELKKARRVDRRQRLRRRPLRAGARRR